jgi:hypothetical protein
MICNIYTTVNFFFALLLVSLVNAQERVYDLEYNPVIFYEDYNPDAANQLGLVKGEYLIVPDTLDVPFFEDFSKDKLFQKPSWDNLVIDTGINRSIQLGAVRDTFEFMTTPSWDYIFNGNGEVIDSTEKDTVRLILNDDIFDLKKRTDTINAWPTFYRYTSLTDSTEVAPDSVIIYSKFDLIQDPDANWLERQVYINNTYVEEKLSLNVATFDGLNENGLPYDPDDTYGPADTLTSQFISLKNFDVNDGLFLSFYYLSTGLGNKPEGIDSLILEFSKNGVWDQVWASPGFDDNNDVIEDWQIALIPLDDNFYFTDNFQFRFRNKASLTGNNDHWHIDYVFLDANRSAIDTVIRDVSVLGAPTNFLSRYTSMPLNQFEGFESQETKEDLFLSYKNNYAVQQSISFQYTVKETISGTSIFTYPKQGTALPPFSPFTIDVPTSDFLGYSVPQDSAYIELTSFIDEIPGALSINNDTAKTLVTFYNYLSYDDGSAEKGYGLEGPGLKYFAYQFNLNVPDTLRAIQFHFTQINFDASDLLFTLYVWKDINTDGSGQDEILYSKEFQRPMYRDVRNGFVTYVLDSPLLIDGDFYVGWDQTAEESIQVGLDMNNSASDYMYYRVGNIWNGSLIDAAPMIRPVLGKEVQYVNVEQPIKQKGAQFNLFPNPSTGLYNIRVDKPGRFIYNVYDLQGKQIKSGEFFGTQAQFSLEEQVSGFYLIQIMDLAEQKAQSFRLIKM